MRSLLPVLLLTSTLLLGACGSRTIPRKGPTIGEIYNGSAVGLISGAADADDPTLRHRRVVGGGASDLAGYTRDSQTELRQLFPQIPNPVLVMYVHPHLAGGKQPIPGYTTAFSMYDHVPFALPGEAGATVVDPSRK